MKFLNQVSVLGLYDHVT